MIVSLGSVSSVENLKQTALAGLAVALGWSTAAPSAADDALQPVFSSCVPTSEVPGSDATLIDHAGRYQLTLVRRVDAVDTGSVRGTVALYPQAPELGSFGGASTSLYGAADVDLRALGAHEAGDIGSDAPDAPGVLVLEFDRDGARNILLRLGSAANRRDAVLPDGAYMVLEVLEISAAGFSGSWRSGSYSSRASGYFCATRSLRRGHAGIRVRGQSTDMLDRLAR